MLWGEKIWQRFDPTVLPTWRVKRQIAALAEHGQEDQHFHPCDPEPQYHCAIQMLRTAGLSEAVCGVARLRLLFRPRNAASAVIKRCFSPHQASWRRTLPAARAPAAVGAYLPHTPLAAYAGWSAAALAAYLGYWALLYATLRRQVLHQLVPVGMATLHVRQSGQAWVFNLQGLSTRRPLAMVAEASRSRTSRL